MRIAIMGAGAIGSLLGGKLAKGHRVLLIGREGHIEAIRKDGLRIEGVTQMSARPQACTSPEDAGPDFKPDILFITTKAYDTDEAAEQASKAWPEIPIIVSMQNGMGNARAISHYFPGATVITVLTTHGATFLEPGRILHAGTGRTVLGRSAGPERDGAKTVQSVLESAGFEAEIFRDIEREVWIKAGINASINPITALLREKNGVILRKDGLLEIVRDVCIEVAGTARACGVSLDAEELFERTVTTARMTADNRSSMLQDVLAGRRTEIERINGEIVRRAEKAGLDVPVTRTLYRMVRGLEME